MFDSKLPKNMCQSIVNSEQGTGAMLMLPALRRLKQGDNEFEISLSCIIRPISKQINKAKIISI